MVTISMSLLDFDTLVRVVQKARKFQASRADPARASTEATRKYAEEECKRLDAVLQAFEYKQITQD